MQPKISHDWVLQSDQERFSRLVVGGLKRSLKVRPPRTASEWADEHFVLVSETGDPEKWRCLPYQKALLDLMGADEPRVVSIQKGAKIGYTKMLCALSGYLLEFRRRNVCFFQPTDTDAKFFSKSEIDSMIREVAVLSDLSAASENRKRDDTLMLKRLGNKLLYVLGATSPARFRRTTVDAVIYDELDGFPREIGEEGDPVALGDRAITNSRTPKSIRGTTPSVAHSSLICRELERASLIFDYYVRCPSCGTAQKLEWRQMRWPAGEDPEKRADKAHYICLECEGRWDYGDIWELLESGQWGTAEGHVIHLERGIDPALLDATGESIRWPRHVALRLWAAYSPYFSWRDLVLEHLDIGTDVQKRKTFVNHRLGEAWEDEGEGVDEMDLFERREAYQVPEEIQVVIAAVDVQKDRVEVVVSGFAANQESWILDVQVLYGLTDRPEESVYEELANWLTCLEYRRDDGLVLRLAAIVIDAGYNSDTIYRLRHRIRHRRVYLIKGIGGEGKPLVRMPPTKIQATDGRRGYLYIVGTDVAKAIIMGRLHKDSASRIHLPLSVDQEICEQLASERRISRMVRGYERKEWVKIRARNEQLDLQVYLLGAVHILRPNWVVLAAREPEDGVVVPEERKQPKRDEVTASAKPSIEEKILRSRRALRRRRFGGNYVSNW